MSPLGAGALMLPLLLARGGVVYDAGAALGLDRAQDAEPGVRYDLWGGVGPWFALDEELELELYASAGRVALAGDEARSSTELAVDVGLAWWPAAWTSLRLTLAGGYSLYGDEAQSGPSAAASARLRRRLAGPLSGEVSATLALARAVDAAYDRTSGGGRLRLLLDLASDRVLLSASYGLSYGEYPRWIVASGSAEPTLGRARAASHAVSLQADLRLFGPVWLGAGAAQTMDDQPTSPRQSLFLSLALRG